MDEFNASDYADLASERYSPQRRRPTNCPNCGAPLGYSPKCPYCGSIVETPPVHVTVVRPGMRKLDTKSVCAVDPSRSSDYVAARTAAYMKMDMVHKLSEALLDAVKITIRKDYDPRLCSEVILMRGELWVADKDPGY